MGYLFTSEDQQLLETHLNNILIINNDADSIEDGMFDVDNSHLVEII